MSRIPAAKAATRKPPPRRAPENVKVTSEAPRDTPTPPTMPVAEPEVTPKPKATKPRANTLEHRLAEALASAAIIPGFAGDQYSAWILSTRSAKFAHDLAELAKVNPRLKKGLENLLDGGAYGGVMFSGAAMILPILWSHRVIPAPPLDPFAAFYEPVPPGILPRSARDGRSSKPATGSGNPSGGDPGPAAVRVPPGGAPASGARTRVPDSPEGVVTVRPDAVPPVNPAAM